MTCPVTAQVHAHAHELGREFEREAAIERIAGELFTRYRNNRVAVGEAIGAAQDRLAIREWLEISALLIADPCEYGHRMQRLLDAELRRQANADAPEEYERRRQEGRPS